MRVITPKGVLCNIKKVIPFIEENRKFNGKVIRLNEPAVSMGVKPNAFKVLFAENIDLYSGSFHVGNLAPEKVQSIMETILKDGFYDFSKLTYQDIDMCTSAVIDNGVSLPYYYEPATSEFYFPCMPNTIDTTEPEEDEEQKDCE